ncbi:hypothetical protein STCU_05702 [Strigomonas culicis]|uniref:Uncharacterized protein n=1 Tax=Strigomonas culicis TaxID=28005 RepID=S9VVS7_9TRYP|nr:hypothetical protein STCU_05702 [Strigomonas culicis]|eukprot:EPY27535.1 hypothetical protein STCU_05702 [Strigomonas culicis]
MLRRSLRLRAGPQNVTDRIKKAQSSFEKWYPKEGGEFLGNFLAGHNLFITDVPKRFDKNHARHFSLVESLTMTPLFALSMVHYFSVFCQYPTRSALIPPMMTELSKKSEIQKEWLLVLQEKAPMDAIPWRVGMLFHQILLFPVWLMAAAAAPQLVHATMAHVNHILHTKYDCISQSGPKFVQANVAPCEFCERLP